MEIRLDRSKFLSELGPMQGIVERRTTIPVLSHILLRADGQRLSLAATDLDVSLTSWVEADVTAAGGVAVQAKKFIEIIRALSDEEITLLQEGEKRLAIVAERSRFQINGLSPEDFPTLPQVEGTVQEIPFNQVKEMISKVLFAVSTEESRFQLNGALFKLKQGGLEMVATDGHRLALVENALDGGRDEDGVLVPRKALQELQRFEGDGALSLCRGEHHLAFRLGRRELVCRILEGTFPDYERVIAKDNDKKVSFARKDLATAVQRVALLTGDRTRAVRFQFEDGKLNISAANPDLGEAMEEVSCDYAGAAFSLGINPDYMSHFLAVVDTERVRFELKDENSQCVGLPVDGEDRRYLCVIMPMRV
ncbi:MAG: DNA polymerase III subunit beta [Acidobacteriota bacterium]|nr:DNA polymerase III subunit beta [Acidobacteriota bacterium]MDH3522269.1 DNA polymerase III subunit beta [Acidobacteriota bacterium]